MNEAGLVKREEGLSQRGSKVNTEAGEIRENASSRAGRPGGAADQQMNATLGSHGGELPG